MASRTRALSGKDANFLLGKFDYSDIFNMVGLSTTRDKADVTVLKDLGKAYVPGHFDGTLRLAGIFSAEEDAVLQSYVEEASEPIISTLVLGSAKGDRAKMSNVVTSEYGIDTPVDDKASISGSGQASGLMHHCVALSNVGSSLAAAASAGASVALGDGVVAKSPYIDLGTPVKWKRIRFHIHLTSVPSTATAVSVNVRSSPSVTLGSGNAANSLTTGDLVNRAGATKAAGVAIHSVGFYAYEIVANEGALLDRYWQFDLNAIGSGAVIYTAAFGRSQE